MNRCHYAESRLRALIDEELPPADGQRVLEHLAQCAGCCQQHARMQAVLALLQDQPCEDASPHFGANLQVRLARHRRDRAEPKPLQRLAGVLRSWHRPQTRPRFRLAASGATTLALAALCAVLVSRGISAAEIARRAEQSWMQVRNYGCVFLSRGVYQGRQRSFQQTQFFRRPDEFRLDTSRDYRLTTFVSPDRVIHYLPGGHWKNRGPLVIIRPRAEVQDALPFPFGVAWQAGGNVSVDRLIHQLNVNQDARVAGEESVGDRECYRLQFSAPPSIAHPEDRYELWIDKENFLPRKVSWFRDADNHIMTEAQSLETNVAVLPAGTFDFQIPEGAKVIEGDVDPHVFAMPFVPDRPASYASAPVAMAEEEGWNRARDVPFPVVMPRTLPRGYELIRVRRRLGHWVDAYWVRDNASGQGAVIKLVEQDAHAAGSRLETGAEINPGTEINLGTHGHPQRARLQQGNTPYPFVSLSWNANGTHCSLFAADLGLEEVERIARSMAPVGPPMRAAALATRLREQLQSPGEPSVLPSEAQMDSPADTREATGAAEATAPAAAESTPMTPEMPDDPVAVASATSRNSQPAVEAAIPGSSSHR